MYVRERERERERERLGVGKRVAERAIRLTFYENSVNLLINSLLSFTEKY